jgi:type IV conjugative transfer system protein TraE
MELARYIAKSTEHLFLKFAIILLVVGFIFQGVVNIWLYQQERIILDPIGEQSSGDIWISGSAAGPGYLIRMTHRLLPLITTFHPNTLEGQIKIFLETVAPEQFGEVRAQLLAQAADARRNDLSQVFFIQKLEPVAPSTVRATGILRRFVGKTPTTEEILSYDLSYDIRSYRPFVIDFHPVSTAGSGSTDRLGK